MNLLQQHQEIPKRTPVPEHIQSTSVVQLLVLVVLATGQYLERRDHSTSFSKDSANMWEGMSRYLLIFKIVQSEVVKMTAELCVASPVSAWKLQSDPSRAEFSLQTEALHLPLPDNGKWAWRDWVVAGIGCHHGFSQG